MFSLIITIVSIALVVALVAATMYYGGDTLSEGRARADAAAFISGGQQIVGALQMQAALEGDAITDLQDLIDKNYLSSLPTVKSDGTGWSLGTVDTDVNVVLNTVLDDATCGAINSQAGFDASDTVTALGDNLYVCITADKEFQIKY